MGLVDHVGGTVRVGIHIRNPLSVCVRARAGVCVCVCICNQITIILPIQITETAVDSLSLRAFGIC